MTFITALLTGAFILTVPAAAQTPANINKVSSRPHGHAVQAKLPEKKPQAKAEEKAPTEPQTATPEPATVQPVPAPETQQPALSQEPVPPPTSSQDLMSQAGIDQNDWVAADYIVSRESGWNPFAVNPNSGSCGLVQELPCGKSGCALGDAVCELRWATSYAVSVYGSWWNAAAFWQANSWW